MECTKKGKVWGMCYVLTVIDVVVKKKNTPVGQFNEDQIFPFCRAKIFTVPVYRATNPTWSIIYLFS
jgi:hypothetical protein